MKILRFTCISSACLPAYLPACLPAYLPAYLPACLLAIRPTIGRRIRPVFSHNTEYWHANTDLLFQLRFIHCVMVSPFILHCFPFSLTGEGKGENHWRGVDKLYGLYSLRHTNGQTHVCLIASSVNIITKRIAAMY